MRKSKSDFPQSISHRQRASLRRRRILSYQMQWAFSSRQPVRRKHDRDFLTFDLVDTVGDSAIFICLLPRLPVEVLRFFLGIDAIRIASIAGFGGDEYHLVVLK